MSAPQGLYPSQLQCHEADQALEFYHKMMKRGHEHSIAIKAASEELGGERGKIFYDYFINQEALLSEEV